MKEFKMKFSKKINYYKILKLNKIYLQKNYLQDMIHILVNYNLIMIHQ